MAVATCPENPDGTLRHEERHCKIRSEDSSSRTGVGTTTRRYRAEITRESRETAIATAILPPRAVQRIAIRVCILTLLLARSHPDSSSAEREGRPLGRFPVGPATSVLSE